MAARIYPAPDAAAIENASVLVHDGRIVAVGPADTVAVPKDTPMIDAHGAVVTAGFWNSHVHLLAPDLHYVHANGVVEDKAEFLRKIDSGERRYRKFHATTREARHESGFTFVFGQAQVQVDRAAGFLSNTLTYTAIYRDAPEPRFLAWHAVKSADA